MLCKLLPALGLPLLAAIAFSPTASAQTSPAPAVSWLSAPSSVGLDTGGPFDGTPYSVNIVTPDTCTLLYVKWYEIDAVPATNDFLDDPGTPVVDPSTGILIGYEIVLENPAGTAEYGGSAIEGAGDDIELAVVVTWECDPGGVITKRSRKKTATVDQPTP